MKKMVIAAILMGVTVFFTGCTPGVPAAMAVMSDEVQDEADDAEENEGEDEALLLEFQEIYNQIEGMYRDVVSQQAELIVSNAAEQDGADFFVHWKTSERETVEWRMRVKFDQTYFSYDTCEKCVIAVDENGQQTVTCGSVSEPGYFEWKEGELYWSGASEEACSRCVFAKVSLTDGEELTGEDLTEEESEEESSDEEVTGELVNTETK